MTKTEQYALMFDESKQPKDAQLILDEATPAFRDAFTEIESIYRQLQTDTIRMHYQIGLRAIQMRNNPRLYGDNALKRLHQVLDYTDSTIAHDVRLAEAFTPEQIDRFCEMRLGNGHPLAYRHLTAIALLNPADRLPMVEEVVRESLTVKELETTVAVKKQLIQPKSNRGRPPKAPKDFRGIVLNLEGYSLEYLKRNKMVWAAQGHSLTDKASDLSSDEVTAERVEMVRKLAADLRQVAEQAGERAKEAEAVYQRLKGIFERNQGLAPRLVSVTPSPGSPVPRESDGGKAVFGKDIVGKLPDAPIPSAATLDPVYLYALERHAVIPRDSGDDDAREGVDDEPAVALAA